MSSANVTLYEIPGTTRKPGVYMEFNYTAAKRLLPANDQPTVIIAQGSDDATQAPLKVFDVYDSDSVGVICGQGSMAHRMVMALQQANPAVSLQMVILGNDPSWNKATATVTLAGTATASGLAQLTIGAEVIQVDVNSGDTAAVTQAALIAAVNADPTLPVVASVAGETSNVLLTLKTRGWVGNLLPVATLTTAAGLTATVPAATITISGTATAAGFSNVTVGATVVQAAVSIGDTAATIQAATVAAINASAAMVVASAIADSTNVLLTPKTSAGFDYDITAAVTAAGVDSDLIQGGFFITNEVHPTVGDFQSALTAIQKAGHKVIVNPFTDSPHMGALVTHATFVSSGVEQRGVTAYSFVDGDLPDAKTLAAGCNSGRIALANMAGALDWAPEIAAAFAGVKVSESDPVRPLDGLGLTGITAPAVDKWMNRSEQEDALHNGVTPLEVGPGGVVQIVRLVSTYTVNSLGVADPTLLDITTITGLDYTRLTCRTDLALAMDRVKNSDSQRRKARSVILQSLYKLQGAEIVQNVDTYKDMLVVEPDDENAGQANARIPANIIPGLHVIAAEIDLI